MCWQLDVDISGLKTCDTNLGPGMTACGTFIIISMCCLFLAICCLVAAPESGGVACPMAILCCCANGAPSPPILSQCSSACIDT